MASVRNQTDGRFGPQAATLVRQLAREIQKDKVFGRAAELAYFFLFSVLPLLLVLTTLLGILAEGETIRRDLLRYFRSVMPASAYELVAGALSEITASAGRGKLSFGILASIFSASAAMVAIIEGLNAAYGVREARPWWKRRVVAVALTLAFAVFTTVALVIILYGNQLGHLLAYYVGLEKFFETAWRFAQWPLMAAFVLTAFAMVYRFAPNLRNQKMKWVIPGAIVAFLCWLVSSFGLRLYLQYFGSYDKVYGSLGAVIALMLWFYLFGVTILIGGEVNSILENAAARAGDPTARRLGEKAPRRPE